MPLDPSAWDLVASIKSELLLTAEAEPSFSSFPPHPLLANVGEESYT